MSNKIHEEEVKLKVGFLRTVEGMSVAVRSLYALACQHGFEFFYFTPEQIDIDKRKIMGKFWENGEYVEKETDFPDIIDNAYYFSSKHPKLYAELLKTSVFTYFSLGGKTKTYQAMEKHANHDYLAKTYFYKDFNVDDAVSKYNKIIIKPDRSNHAQNIYKLHKEGDLYALQLDDNTQMLTKDEFEAKYDEQFRKFYTIQPFINSITNEGSPLNIRALIHRGKDGEWTYPRISCRIGRKGHIAAAAHLGSLAYYHWFFPSEFGDNWKEVYNKLVFVTRHLANAIQKDYPRPIDAFGFDLGIDRSNNNAIKVFEANTYPAGAPFELSVAESKVGYYKHIMANYDSFLEKQIKHPY